MTITFSGKILEKKIEFLEIGPFIKGTLKNPGINFHENLKKIVKIKV